MGVWVLFSIGFSRFASHTLIQVDGRTGMKQKVGETPLTYKLQAGYRHFKALALLKRKVTAKGSPQSCKITVWRVFVARNLVSKRSKGRSQFLVCTVDGKFITMHTFRQAL